jgi:tyrosinase
MANGIVIRPSTGQANIPAIRDAYGQMQGFSETDNRSWIFWAEYHGFNRFDCWHHSRLHGTLFPYDLFLPWHRAYLLNFQQVMLDLNSEAIQPWWDWTSDTSHEFGLPQSYTEDADSNPLATGPMPSIQGQPQRRTNRDPSPPDGLPSYTEEVPPNPAIDSILALTQYEDFSLQLQDVHDFMHGWVGGDMGVVATSAFDPIFFAHHTMIDRIWYQWQLQHGVNNIPPNYFDKVLAPFNLTVSDVLDVHALGYEYASSAVTAGPAEGRGGGGGGASAAADPPARAEEEPPATVGGAPPPSDHSTSGGSY